MKIPLSSFSYLMRTVVARKIDLVRNPNSLIVGHRLMHTVACERESERCLLSLHVGAKNVAACLYNPATREVVTVGYDFLAMCISIIA